MFSCQRRWSSHRPVGTRPAGDAGAYLSHRERLQIANLREWKKRWRRLWLRCSPPSD